MKLPVLSCFATCFCPVPNRLYFDQKQGGRQVVKETQFTVTESTTLLPFLLAKFEHKGRNKVKALLARGQILVEKHVVTKFDHPLRPGDHVTILQASSIQQKELMVGVKILFEDDHLIVIDKPPSLLSIATDEEKTRTAYHILTDYVRERNSQSRVFIVHRLDRETSGLMVFAKSEAVKLLLQEHWKEMILERSYIALVEGVVRKKSATIRTWLKESATQTMYVTHPGDGVEAITHYQVIKQTPEYSLLAVQLETGRKNQIRVHLQSIGHSVVGDKRYGAKTNPIGRLGLHANILAFMHPVTGAPHRFVTPIPAKFQTLFATSDR